MLIFSALFQFERMIPEGNPGAEGLFVSASPTCEGPLKLGDVILLWPRLRAIWYFALADPRKDLLRCGSESITWRTILGLGVALLV